MWFSLRLITLIILNVSTLLLLYYILISSRTCHSYLIAQYTFVKIINKNRLVKWSETIGQVCVDCWKFWGFNQSSCQRGYLSIYIRPVTSLCIIIFESLLIPVTFIRENVIVNHISLYFLVSPISLKTVHWVLLVHFHHNSES